MTFFKNFFTFSRSTNGLISCSAKSKLKLPEFVYITHVVVPVCLKIKSWTHVQLFLTYSVISVSMPQKTVIFSEIIKIVNLKPILKIEWLFIEKKLIKITR